MTVQTRVYSFAMVLVSVDRFGLGIPKAGSALTIRRWKQESRPESVCGIYHPAALKYVAWLQ